MRADTSQGQTEIVGISGGIHDTHVDGAIDHRRVDPPSPSSVSQIKRKQQHYVDALLACIRLEYLKGEDYYNRVTSELLIARSFPSE